MTKSALEDYSRAILSIDSKIEKCLSDIETILKEDLTRDGAAKTDFTQWRLQYDAAVIEIESSDLTAALRSVLEEIHLRSEHLEPIEGVLLPLVDYIKSIVSVPPLNSYPASCPFCPNYVIPDGNEQESLQLLSAIGQHMETDLLRKYVPAKCDIFTDEPCVHASYRRKLALLKSLYDAEYVNDLHWKIREKQLASFECTCCREQCLFCFLEICAKCLALDMALIDSGLFQPLQVCDKQLHSIYNKCVLDYIEIILDEKLETDGLHPNRNTFRCRLREQQLGVKSVPQLADEGITQILQDMNWFDGRLKYYLAKYAYGDTHISVDTNWVSQSVRNVVSSLETLVPGVTAAWQNWSTIKVDEERFKTVACSMDGSERSVRIFGPAWDFLLHLQRFSAIVGKSNSKSLVISLNHFLHTGIDVVTATCGAVAKRDTIDEKTYIAYNSVAYVRMQIEDFQNKNGDIADLPTGVIQKIHSVEDSLEYHIVCHHIKWAASSARHTLYDFTSIQKPDMDAFTLAPASLHVFMESFCRQLAEELCQPGCQKVIVRVWSELCTMMCSTYVQVPVSSQQVNLLSRDIDVVLNTSFNVLLFVCDGVEEILGIYDGNENPRKIRHVKNIHASCVLLLSTKYLSDSSVEYLYQNFKGGYAPDRSTPLGVMWVSHLFQNSLSGAAFKIDTAPNILVWMLLEMMRVQKNFKFVLCIKAMRSFSHMLAILLVRQGCTGAHLNEEERTALMDCALSLGLARPPCETSHSFVGDMLIPIVDKTNSWAAFGSDSLNANRPWWYKVLQRSLKPFARSVLLSISDLVQRKTANDSRWKTTREKLQSFVGEKQDDDTKATEEAERILQHMVDHLALVSRDILTCFATMDDRKEEPINPLLNSIGLQFILNTICDCLKDSDFLKQVYGVQGPPVEENCRFLCESFQDQVFGELKGHQLHGGIKRKLEIIKETITRYRGLFASANINSKATDYVENFLLPQSAFDHQIQQQLTSEQMIEKLETIRSILKSNNQWFRRSLGVDQIVTFAQPAMKDHEIPLRTKSFDEPDDAKNPLRSYSLWRLGCTERIDSLKGVNPQISCVQDAISEFNFSAILRRHPLLFSNDYREIKEAKVLRSLFQLSKIPDEEHWQKFSNV